MRRMAYHIVHSMACSIWHMPYTMICSYNSMQYRLLAHKIYYRLWTMDHGLYDICHIRCHMQKVLSSAGPGKGLQYGPRSIHMDLRHSRGCTDTPGVPYPARGYGTVYGTGSCVALMQGVSHRVWHTYGLSPPPCSSNLLFYQWQAAMDLYL